MTAGGSIQPELERQSVLTMECTIPAGDRGGMAPVRTALLRAWPLGTTSWTSNAGTLRRRPKVERYLLTDSSLRST
jgi:hypothetical protein